MIFIHQIYLHCLFNLEHNLDVIKSADWIVDLGPEGGSGGGLVIAEGTPEQVAANPDSHTGRFLAPVLAKTSRTTTRTSGRATGNKGTGAKAPAKKAPAKKDTSKGTPAKKATSKTSTAKGGKGMTSTGTPAKTAAKTAAKRTATKAASAPRTVRQKRAAS